MLRTCCLRGRLLAGVLLAGSLAFAQFKGPVMAIERLANSNILVTDPAADLPGPAARVIEIDTLGRIVWAYLGSNIPDVHTARRLANGNTLISATGVNRVLEVDPGGTTVWSLDSGLVYPNEAVRLESGNTLITDRDNNRVIEVRPDGAVVWEYGGLALPHNGTRLPDGHTLICDSDRNRVIEVDSSGSTVWQYGVNLNWPRSVERLPNGNTLIGCSGFAWATEVAPDGRVVRIDSGPFSGAVYTATRLPSGRTLVSVDYGVVELGANRSIVWQWPGTVPVRVDTLRVLNPGSGCSLYVHIHRPVTSTHANRLPGIILVPDAQHPGTFFDFLDFADKLADAGFVVLHFDADGRGQSPGWPEDYGGFVHQDGLHACLELLARQTEVDSQCLGIVARGDGTTMTTGAVARYPSPVVSFLLDDEGPADRHQSCVDSGGTIPVAPDSELFWQEREAGRFAKRVPAAYLRLQTTTSPNPRIPGNRDCIAMIDSMTAVTHGGRGVSRWTRVNDSAMNPPNKVYDDGRRPTVIPDEQELHTLIRCLLYLRELSRLPVQAVAESDLHPPSAALKLSVSPNPARSPVRVHFDVSPAGRLLPAEFSLRLYNATGRLVRTLATGPLLTGANGLAAGDWNLDTGRSRLEPGVFLLRLVAGSHSLSRKLVVE